MSITEAQASVVYAETPAGAGGTSAGLKTEIMGFIPLILIFAVFYFLLIRPQQKRIKEHRAVLETLQKGSGIVTSGGLIGRVIRISNDGSVVEAEFGSRPGSQVCMQILKNTIAQVTDEYTKGEYAKTQSVAQENTKNRKDKDSRAKKGNRSSDTADTVKDNVEDAQTVEEPVNVGAIENTLVSLDEASSAMPPGKESKNSD